MICPSEVKVTPDMGGCPSLNRGDYLVPLLRLRMVPGSRPLCRLGYDDGLFARMASVLRSSSAYDDAISNRSIVRNAGAHFRVPLSWVPAHERYPLEIMTAAVDDGRRPPARNRGSKPEFTT
jgi:hypothetical protein